MWTKSKLLYLELYRKWTRRKCLAYCNSFVRFYKQTTNRVKFSYLVNVVPFSVYKIEKISEVTTHPTFFQVVDLRKT